MSKWRQNNGVYPYTLRQIIVQVEASNQPSVSLPVLKERIIEKVAYFPGGAKNKAVHYHKVSEHLNIELSSFTLLSARRSIEEGKIVHRVWSQRSLSVIRRKCASTGFCHGLLKNLHVPAKDRTGDPSIYSLALYHVAIKAGLYRKAVQVYYIPNLYPVTFSPSILNSSSNSQEYKNHWK